MATDRLTYRPIARGSAQHRELLERVDTNRKLGRILYPSLAARQESRRAFAAMAASSRRQSEIAEATGLPADRFTAPRPSADGIEDGRSTECA